MFYSNQILARKGPLGLVWIAAHMDRQLKRQQINSTSIPASVDTLLDPEVPLALRLSGQLLLGVVRIYARKVSTAQHSTARYIPQHGTARHSMAWCPPLLPACTLCSAGDRLLQGLCMKHEL